MPAPVATRTRLAPSRASRTRTRVSAVARTWRALRAAGLGDGRGSVERARDPFEQEVVVLGVAHGGPDAVREDADDQPGAEQRRAELLRGRRPARRRSSSGREAARARVPAGRGRGAPAPRPAARRRAGPRARRPRARRRAWRSARAPGGGSARRRSRRRRARSRRARPRGRRPSRTSATTTTPSSIRPAAVSPAYSKYASSTTSGLAAGRSPSAPLGLFGRQQNVTTGSSSAISAPARFAAMRKSG